MLSLIFEGEKLDSFQLRSVDLLLIVRLKLRHLRMELEVLVINGGFYDLDAGLQGCVVLADLRVCLQI